MAENIGTIAIRNPKVIQVAASEAEQGAGRNATEAAENLILEAAERRRIDRAKATDHHAGASGREERIERKAASQSNPKPRRSKKHSSSAA